MQSLKRLIGTRGFSRWGFVEEKECCSSLLLVLRFLRLRLGRSLVTSESAVRYSPYTETVRKRFLFSFLESESPRIRLSEEGKRV